MRICVTTHTTYASDSELFWSFFYGLYNSVVNLKAKAKDLTSKTSSRTALKKLLHFTSIMQNEIENSNFNTF